ncbi:hypothetical protein D477_007004 [Arthrobacter crystallopoietes BAB-32]|uniref:Lipoprotein n=1 Tax=Arthrobacter crystallopoietes BAB-32 TaxID=1246476 RepID=N1V0T9_9MICC|nr:hypothetical protein [Arthrobacter crystallopoietes]EMY34935.1 hypothetical protein D477_007004 [Arthrobacter crystallopoietes BAB-32]
MSYGKRTHQPCRTRQAAAALALAALAVSGCGNDTAGPETGTDVEEVQPDVIRDTVEEAEEAGDGESVTVSAKVNEIISPLSFTIAGTDDTTVDPLLVVHDDQLPEVEPGQIVQITGTVYRNIQLPRLEETAGIDLDDTLHQEWEDKTCIVASQVSLLEGTGY